MGGSSECRSLRVPAPLFFTSLGLWIWGAAFWFVVQGCGLDLYSDPAYKYQTVRYPGNLNALH